MLAAVLPLTALVGHEIYVEAQKSRAQAIALGVNSYIQKPVEFEAFAKEVADVGLYWLLANKVPR